MPPACVAKASALQQEQLQQLMGGLVDQVGQWTDAANRYQSTMTAEVPMVEEPIRSTTLTEWWSLCIAVIR